MDTTLWIVIAVVAALVVVALAAWAYARSKRRATLQEQFGPEYDRTVSAAKSRREAERELEEREKAHEQLDIRPLSQAARDRYTEDWQRAEQQFVDDPELAARQADRIVRSVLEERGYPRDDFDSQAAAVSVDHPHVVDRYRHGHEMVHGNGAAGQERTENLRKAMVDFRSVFEQLVEDVETPAEVEEPATA
jgi:ABC-type nickel/cobalt efflux system permease component RcnA